jgi:hypothetical protein
LLERRSAKIVSRSQRTFEWISEHAAGWSVTCTEDRDGLSSSGACMRCRNRVAANARAGSTGSLWQIPPPPVALGPTRGADQSPSQGPCPHAELCRAPRAAMPVCEAAPGAAALVGRPGPDRAAPGGRTGRTGRPLETALPAQPPAGMHVRQAPPALASAKAHQDAAAPACHWAASS